jgi:raffinose/stachyose/melibiose transport system permease protein
MSLPKTATSTLDVEVSRGSRFRSGSSASTKKKKNIHYGYWWWSLPAILMIFAVHYVATGIGISYSFTDYKGIGAFNWIGFENYTKIFKDEILVDAIGHTVFLAVTFFILVNIIGLSCALAVNRSLKTRHILRTLLFLPVVLSPLAVSYIFQFIFVTEGPVNSLLGAVGLENWQRTWLADPKWAIYTVLVVMVWQNIGFAMVIFLAGLATIPQEIEEAAAIDGAGAFSRFWHITLPLLRPATAISTTLAVTTGLRVFDQVQGLTGGGPFNATETLATQIYANTFIYGQFGYGSAIAFIFTIVVMIAAGIQLFVTRDKGTYS